MSNKILDCLVNVTPYLKDLFTENVSIVVVDREKILAHCPGKIDADVDPGDPIISGWSVITAMKEGKKIVKEVDASVIGIPYIGIACPIYDDEGKEVIGGITVSNPTDRKEKLLEVSRKLSSYTDTFAENLEEITAEGEEVAATGKDLNNISSETQEKMLESKKVVSLVKSITEDINMLGLNAMIEAARVGEEGRGFTVVANEVQKLATNTTNSISNVEKTFEDIKKIMNELHDVAQQIDKISEAQAEKLVEITEKTNQLSELGNDVVKLAEGLGGK